MQQQLNKVQSLLIQVELQLYQLKKQLKLRATQELTPPHLKEETEATLAHYQYQHQLHQPQHDYDIIRQLPLVTFHTRRGRPVCTRQRPHIIKVRR